MIPCNITASQLNKDESKFSEQNVTSIAHLHIQKLLPYSILWSSIHVKKYLYLKQFHSLLSCKTIFPVSGSTTLGTLSTISVTVKYFFLLNLWHSLMTTRSPIAHSLFSSWAKYTFLSLKNYNKMKKWNQQVKSFNFVSWKIKNKNKTKQKMKIIEVKQNMKTIKITFLCSNFQRNTDINFIHIL